MQQAFRGRKSNPTQNVMAVVNFYLKFTYVLVGWEGSAHDALILVDVIVLTVYFGTPNMFITLWFRFDYGTNPPLGTLII
jgi:hypothetical protein